MNTVKTEEKIEEKIQKAHYAVTEHEVELLATARLVCDEATKRADGTYLRILLAKLQAQFGAPPPRGRRKDPTTAELENHRIFLSDTHSKYYKAVLRGVSTPDVEDVDGLKPEDRRARAAKRNARAGFARSAASTLQLYIKSGGDVRTLDVDTVTKSGLRDFAKASGESNPPTVAAIGSALKRIETQAKALMLDDPDEARAAVEDCIRRLQSLLDQSAPQMPTVRSNRVGVESGVFQRARGPTARASRGVVS